MTKQNFIKIVWTVEKFEIFIERSGEKNDTIAKVVENFFQLLKYFVIMPVARMVPKIIQAN